MTRLLHYLNTNLMLDLEVINQICSDPRTLRVIYNQADAFIKRGDRGFDTLTFRDFEQRLRANIVEKFGKRYSSLDKEFKAEEKAKRAWLAFLNWFVITRLIDAAEEYGKAFIPRRLLRPEGLDAPCRFISEVLEELEELIDRGPAEERQVFFRVLKGKIESELKAALEKGSDTALDIMPFLWWVNIVMEAEVIDGILAYHYLYYKFFNEIEGLTRKIVNSLSNNLYTTYKPDVGWARENLLRGLISATTGLEGDFIGRLHNVIALLKLLRVKPKFRERYKWRWFLTGDPLTYTLSVYITFPQELVGISRIKLLTHILRLDEQFDKENHASSRNWAPAASTLLLLSPIFIQYRIERNETYMVTPADVIISLLVAERNWGRDIHVKELAKAMLDFWEKRRVRKVLIPYIHMPETLEEIYTNEGFTASLALMRAARIGGVHVYRDKEGLFRVPFRRSSFDRLVIDSEIFESSCFEFLKEAS